MLQATGLSKSFGGVRAVRNVSLAVPEKSIFALIGPNGAGKSTLLNLLSGIYQPDEGSLAFAGKDLVGVPAYRRVRLGVARTFQKIRLFKQLTLLENVRAGFHVHQDAPFWRYLVRPSTGRFDAEARELLEFVGLGARAHERAASLPYGQQRMLEIARALATRPRFILLDEPFAGVDPIAVLDIQQIIRFLKTRGIGVLITDHNVRETLGICDHAYIINQGAVLAFGKPQEIIYNEAVRKVYLGENFRL
jgi:lipopolysaccharide export system ATP-binding protein